MEIELKHPYAAHIRTGAYVWNPEKYELLPHSEWINWVRDVMKDKRLFLYRPKRKAQFVLAGWIFRPGEWGPGLFMPLRGMPAHPDSNGGSARPDIHQLQSICSRVDVALDRAKRELRAERDEEMAGYDETAQSRKDLATYYRHSGLDMEAHLVERDIIPHISRREAGAEAYDMIEEGLK